MIGCGSMGGGMALLFAEHGMTVCLNDPSEDNVNSILETAKKEGLQDKLEKHESYEDLCKSLESPKVFFLSLPHGTAGDTVIQIWKEVTSSSMQPMKIGTIRSGGKGR